MAGCQTPSSASTTVSPRMLTSCKTPGAVWTTLRLCRSALPPLPSFPSPLPTPPCYLPACVAQWLAAVDKLFQMVSWSGLCANDKLHSSTHVSNQTSSAPIKPQVPKHNVHLLICTSSVTHPQNQSVQSQEVSHSFGSQFLAAYSLPSWHDNTCLVNPIGMTTPA